MAETVLVTGGTGFIGGWCVAELLKRGYAVRATVRSLAKEKALRSCVGAAAGSTERLSVAVADLTRDDGWDAAMEGCAFVLHVASPLGASGAALIVYETLEAIAIPFDVACDASPCSVASFFDLAIVNALKISLCGVATATRIAAAVGRAVVDAARDCNVWTFYNGVQQRVDGKLSSLASLDTVGIRTGSGFDNETIHEKLEDRFDIVATTRSTQDSIDGQRSGRPPSTAKSVRSVVDHTDQVRLPDLERTIDETLELAKKAGRVELGDLGAPLASTSYDLCLYDAGGLRMTVSVPPGGTCPPGQPCWRSFRQGFAYRDSDGTSQGVGAVLLRSGDGRAGVKLNGRGASMPLPALPLFVPVTVQLVSSEGTCWGAQYTFLGGDNLGRVVGRSTFP